MSAEDVLKRAKASGVVLRVDGEQIRCRGPEDAVSTLLPQLQAHKRELIAALRGVEVDPSERSEHWLLSKPGERPRELFCSPAASRVELMEAHPGASLVALPSKPDLPKVASCAACVHRTIYRNCNSPVLAGLSKRFELVAHPDGGRGCTAFLAKTADVDPEIEALIQAIAQRYGFTADDIDEMRLFATKHPEYAREEFRKWL